MASASSRLAEARSALVSQGTLPTCCWATSVLLPRAIDYLLIQQPRGPLQETRGVALSRDRTPRIVRYLAAIIMRNWSPWRDDPSNRVARPPAQ
jgi:hypothetical protein